MSSFLAYTPQNDHGTHSQIHLDNFTAVKKQGQPAGAPSIRKEIA